ncbi:MAG: [Fe-Fe] hydrogenase large subunit C-terminal domain-containing protein [Acetanaerobacterium sp.]
MVITVSEKFFHSVTLDPDLCQGCTHCIKRCPTEAIRVRDGKAYIISDRCIDCGECVRVCPHHAKKPQYDSLDILNSTKYKVALPAPALYGQFNNLDDVDILLTALKKMGFDDVFEVSRAAEIISDATRRLMEENKLKKPVISSACPTIVRLIRVRFPELLDNLLQLNAPIELAAIMAREEAVKKTGRAPEDIGIVFISPCPAKVTAVKMPLGVEKSNVDAVVAIKEVYTRLLPYMKEVADSPETLSASGRMGISWASSGGEASAMLNENYLAADGIENVIAVLEALEDEKFSDLDFIELNSCPAGCVGGVLTVENPYVARTRLKRLRKYLPVSCNHVTDDVIKQLTWDKGVEYAPVLELADNVTDAMHMLKELERIAATLPGIDCGSCGAPTCRALAEDIVRGKATEALCVYKMRERMQTLTDELSQLGEQKHEQLE